MSEPLQALPHVCQRWSLGAMLVVGQEDHVQIVEAILLNKQVLPSVDVVDTTPKLGFRALVVATNQQCLLPACRSRRWATDGVRLVRAKGGLVHVLKDGQMLVAVKGFVRGRLGLVHGVQVRIVGALQKEIYHLSSRTILHIVRKAAPLPVLMLEDDGSRHALAPSAVDEATAVARGLHRSAIVLPRLAVPCTVLQEGIWIPTRGLQLFVHCPFAGLQQVAEGAETATVAEIDDLASGAILEARHALPIRVTDLEDHCRIHAFAPSTHQPSLAVGGRRHGCAVRRPLLAIRGQALQKGHEATTERGLPQTFDAKGWESSGTERSD